jgi:hypothetical protein
MHERSLHIVELLVRRRDEQGVVFLLYPHAAWKTADGKPCFTLPTKTSVDDCLEPFEHGASVDYFLDELLGRRLGLPPECYALEQELDAVSLHMPSPTHGVETSYTVFPLDVWVEPAAREILRGRLGGVWFTPSQALADARLSPTAREVLTALLEREQSLNELYAQNPVAERAAEAPRRLLVDAPAKPSMEALAKRWFAQNRAGVRVLSKPTLDEILNTGDRAFNLRVADPYLRYQQQGLGFTWSFFTHKDRQDIHVHGAPVVEIYGVLEGRLEIWWKPYFDRGTSAWNHRVLEAGGWIEVDSLQCHIVHWLTEGKGVVFKAGPGPLAEVGKLGVKGKTPCAGCPCKKPVEVTELVS